MARIRTIKPSLWTSPEFVACSMAARLLWIGTWNFADDYGVLKDDPAELKFQILPGDNVDAHDLVDELVSRKMLLRKVAPDGTRVLVIRTFGIHQKIDTRSPGRWGVPTDFADAGPAVSAVPRDQDECRPANQSQPIPTSPDPGREGKGNPLVQPSGPHDDDGAFGAGFRECWELYPRKRDRKAALMAYRARRRSGVSHDELLKATENYAASRKGEPDKFTLLGATFYGPHDKWVDWVNPAPNVQLPERGYVER